MQKVRVITPLYLEQVLTSTAMNDSAPAIKVCGITREADAQACIKAGVSWLGFNFWPRSKRYCAPEQAAQIVATLPAHVRSVALFVDAEQAIIDQVLRMTGLRWVQLHGQETPDMLNNWLPQAFKALPVRDATIHAEAARYSGDYIVLDAAVQGLPGGTGQCFDWRFAAPIARYRQVILAGGLTPTNVADAIRQVRPAVVDVASGVESQPGVKDPDKIHAFVDAVRLTGQEGQAH